MSETALQWLGSLNDLYTPTPSEFEAARSHRAAIESRLDAYLGLHEMFEIGSLKHGTGVWKYSDADFMVSLKGIRPSSPLTMLNKVKETLQGRFTTTTIVTRQPAVVCKFSDATVEIVPAYAADSGYWIADPRGGWMKTHPKNHNAYVNEVNTKHSGAAKRLARQLKVWKYRRDAPISSCYLEMRAAKHMDGESSYSAFWDLHAALNKMHVAELAAMNDPTGLGSRFGSTSSDSSHADAMSKLARAVLRAQRAKEYAANSDHENAINQLKLLFNR